MEDYSCRCLNVRISQQEQQAPEPEPKLPLQPHFRWVHVGDTGIRVVSTPRYKECTYTGPNVLVKSQAHEHLTIRTRQFRAGTQQSPSTRRLLLTCLSCRSIVYQVISIAERE